MRRFAMHPTDMTNGDGYQGRVNVWRVVRWAITAAASLVLAVLFVTTAVTTQAAAPAADTDTVVYHTMATCNAGDAGCIVAQCQNGNYNFCGYNLGGVGSVYGFPYGPQNFSTYNPAFYNNVGYIQPYSYAY